VPSGALRQRRLHKAFLRYHDANNWPMLREALRAMGREDHDHPGQPAGKAHEGRRGGAPRGPRPTSGGGVPGARPRRGGRVPQPGDALTQHTGLPPRAHTAGAASKPRRGPR
jgi:hypothetical protein